MIQSRTTAIASVATTMTSATRLQNGCQRGASYQRVNGRAIHARLKTQMSANAPKIARARGIPVIGGTLTYDAGLMQ